MSKFDEVYREKLLKGEIILQTKEEYLEYRKILPDIMIKGLEEIAATMNKLESCMKKASLGGKSVKEGRGGREQ